MPLGNERQSVQNPLIKYTAEINWTYITPDDALKWRGGETGLVFRDTFITQLQKLNAFMTQSLSEELLKRIETLPSNIEGNLLTWEYLKGLKQVFVPDLGNNQKYTKSNNSGSY
jgi:type I restriction enzyme R subunit